ncbi:MAG: hypothetical protein KGI73_00880 [Patescibacteria group bacterium]|nr:hypothetical protein [Patescibacteria group bacterium]
MKNPLLLIVLATQTVLKSTRYKLWFLALTALLIAAYLFLPVWLTPGNTLAFQLGLFTTRDYLLFLFLSASTALLMLMQVFVFVRSRRARIGAVGQGSVGLASALFAGLLATAACSSCIAAVIGFLGAGSVFFVVGHQWYFVYGGIALVLVGLYFSARRVQVYCEDCEVRTVAPNQS